MLRFDAMFDTFAIARQLKGVGLDPEHAEAVADAVRQAAKHQQLDVAILATRADLATLEARLIKGVLGIILAVAGLQTAALFALLRPLI